MRAINRPENPKARGCILCGMGEMKEPHCTRSVDRGRQGFDDTAFCSKQCEKMYIGRALSTFGAREMVKVMTILTKSNSKMKNGPRMREAKKNVPKSMVVGSGGD